MRYLCILVALFAVTSSRIAEDVASHVNDVIDHADDPDSLFDDNVDDIIESPFRYAKRNRRIRFPKGVVPYVINKGFTKTDVKYIKQQMDVLQNFTKSGDTFCIKFRPKRNTDRLFLDIYPHEIKCDSYIGAKYGGTYMRLAPRCIPRSVIHEVMHAIGFQHEHNRDDRDNYVTVLWNQVPNDLVRSYTIKSLVDFTNQSIPYDYGSATHYTDHLLPKRDNYMGGHKKALGVRMSEYDVLRIQRYYSCPENNTEYKNAKPVVFNCTFENGLCNMTQNKGRLNFEWTRRKAQAGRESDRGFYLTATAKNHQRRVARLTSPVIEGGDCFIISMAYYRDGFKDGNSVHLYARDAVNGLQALTSYFAKLGDYWASFFTTKYLQVPWSLMIDATIGVNSTTDIAIDDIMVVKGCKMI